MSKTKPDHGEARLLAEDAVSLRQEFGDPIVNLSAAYLAGQAENNSLHEALTAEGNRHDDALEKLATNQELRQASDLSLTGLTEGLEILGEQLAASEAERLEIGRERKALEIKLETIAKLEHGGELERKLTESQLAAGQAERAEMSERIRGLENALRGMLGVVEHCDHYQKTHYRQCTESREAECALAGTYVGPYENGRLAPGHGDPDDSSFICPKCQGFRGRSPGHICDGRATRSGEID